MSIRNFAYLDVARKVVSKMKETNESKANYIFNNATNQNKKRARHARSHIFFVLIMSIITAIIAVPSNRAFAASFVVNTLMDDLNDDSMCTLREAILAANNTPANQNCGAGSNADDTITFSVSGTITLVSQLPEINAAATTGALTIDGGENITISGNESVRVFYVGSQGDLVLNNLTVSNGNPGAGNGGGGLAVDGGKVTLINTIFSDHVGYIGGAVASHNSRVTFLKSTFSRNEAFLGGGLLNGGGDVVIVNSFFAENRGSSGGGIFNGEGLIPGTGTMTVLNTTFSANEASFGAGLYNGGGKVTIANSTFADNEASAGAGISNGKGGIATVRNSAFVSNLAFRGSGFDNFKNAKATIVNSTISGNTANSEGGGIANTKKSALTIINSTISGNTAKAKGGNVANNSSVMTVKNTIIANSMESMNCVGEIAAASTKNLSTDESCGTSFKVVTLAEMNLGTLIGTPSYFPLNPGSVAIDTGNNAICATAPVNHQSQNGILRPQGGSGKGITRCDIGAYEAPNPCTTKPSKPPHMKSPSDGAVLHTSQPILKWTTAPCAARYFIFVVDIASGQPADTANQLFTLRYQTKPLAHGKTYRWFVTACNDFGCESTDNGRTFTLQP